MSEYQAEVPSKPDHFEQAEFQDALDEFFELALGKVESGELAVERFDRLLRAATKLS